MDPPYNRQNFNKPRSIIRMLHDGPDWRGRPRDSTRTGLAWNQPDLEGYDDKTFGRVDYRTFHAQDSNARVRLTIRSDISLGHNETMHERNSFPAALKNSETYESPITTRCVGDQFELPSPDRKETRQLRGVVRRRKPSVDDSFEFIYESDFGDKIDDSAWILVEEHSV